MISDQQLTQDQDVQSLARAAHRLGREQAAYRTRGDDVQALIDQMRRKLEEAKAKIQAVVGELSQARLYPNPGC